MQQTMTTTESTKPPASWPNLDAGAYGLIQTGIWIVAIVVVTALLRRQLGEIVAAILVRLRAGAPLEIASFKICALPYVVRGASDARPGRGLVEIREDNGTFHASREVFRTELRNLFLVHKIAPSSDPKQLYDIILYVVPSLKYGSLSGVMAVEYYFGMYWKQKVFRSIDRASGFMIATSAYAPFTATARVSFSDGSSVFLHRYVDFEMGQLQPPGTFRRKDA